MEVAAPRAPVYHRITFLHVPPGFAMTLRLSVLVCALALVLSQSMIAAEPAWKEVVVTDDWKKAPVGDKGFLWYRAKVAVPQSWQGRQLDLAVEAIDDAREIYFGGQLIGTLGEFPP